MNNLKHISSLLFSMLFVANAFSQKMDSTIAAIQQLPNKYYNQVDKKISTIDNKLTKKSEKYLKKFRKQEERIQNKLKSLDSTSSRYFAHTSEKYNELLKLVKDKTGKAGSLIGGQYNSYLDSLGTSLKFINKLGDVKKAEESLKNLTALQSKLQSSEKIQEFISERKKQIKELLSKYNTLPKGLTNQYKALSKSAYYYSAQIKEYKEMLKDEKKMEKQALALLNKLPAFQKFMKQNSQLAALFGMSGNNNADPTKALAGLQTRASIQSLIQQQIAVGGPNAQSQIQQNIAQGHAEMDKLKDKINKFGGGGGSDINMPDFKPNSQKTKCFLKRIEYGLNVQFAKSTNLLPKTAEIGLSIGFKINDKSVIGIGASHKMGLGTFQHFNISYEGIGLRSYLDYKIKKTYYITGGFEENYNAAFKDINALKYVQWQQSALMGFSKKYQVSKKLKGEFKILYDFLANQHVPSSQPLIFRLGYKI